METEQIARAVRGSSVAELAWTDPDGAPDGCGVVALPWRSAPAVAFTYALEPQARAAAAAPLVALSLTESRSTGTSFAPLAVVGRPRLVEDVDGTLFTDELLDEELRRYPPARTFADSAMLRREHWWYLPRLILTVDVRTVHPLPARATPREHVLVVAEHDALTVGVVAAPDRVGAEDTWPLVAGGDLGRPSGPAALIGQDASFPDLEQWASWCFRGVCDGSRFRATRRPPTVGLPPVPSIWQRARRQRGLGRACRAGIARAERRS